MSIRDRIECIAAKFAAIDAYIGAGEPVPDDLSENFVSFDLVDDPYKYIE